MGDVRHIFGPDGFNALLYEPLGAGVIPFPSQPDPDGLEPPAEGIPPNMRWVPAYDNGKRDGFDLEYIAPPVWPQQWDGLVQGLAKFYYEAAPRPFEEIALAGALATIQGIAGYRFRVRGLSLNMGFTVLARTGRGKSAAVHGWAAIKKAAAAHHGTHGGDHTKVYRHDGPGVLGSAAGAAKYLSDMSEKGSRSAFSIVKDAANFIATLGKGDNNGTLLRQFILNSLDDNHFGAKAVINAESRYRAFHFAFTMVLEAQPEPYFKACNPQMLDEGGLSRFLVLQYDGLRMPTNPRANQSPPSGLIEDICRLIDYVGSGELEAICLVSEEPAAAQLLNDFDKYCTRRINEEDGGSAEVWNRGFVMALKIAATEAVGMNHLAPVITEAQARRAIQLVKSGLAPFHTRVASGRIGEPGEAEADEAIDKAIAFFRKASPDLRRTYRTPEALVKQKELIPGTFFYQYLRKQPVFKDHRLGPSEAIEKGLKRAVADGDRLSLVDPADPRRVVVKNLKRGKLYC